MPRVPAESPIAVSSESPTADSPAQESTQSRARHSSSLLPSPTAGPSTRPTQPIASRSRPSELDDDDELSSIGGSTRLPHDRGSERQVSGSHPFNLSRTARPFRPATTSARPHGLAIPSGSGSGSRLGPSVDPIDMASRGGQNRMQAIDLTEDDDDIEVIAETRAAPRARRIGPGGPLLRDFRQINQVTAQRELAYLHLFDEDAQDNERRRARTVVNSPFPLVEHATPTPAALVQRAYERRAGTRAPRVEHPGMDTGPRPRIGLGGAVFRGGGQQITYQPDLPPRRRPPPGALVDDDFDERAGPDNPVIARILRRVTNPVPDYMAVDPQAALPYQPQARPRPQPQPQARPPRRAAEGLYDYLWPGGENAAPNDRVLRGMRARDNGGSPGLLHDMAAGGRLPNEGPDLLADWIGRDPRLLERLREIRDYYTGLGQNTPAGRAPSRAPDNPQSIISQVPNFEYPPAPEGFTSNFEIDSTIEIDQPASTKRFLACIYCVEPLLLQSGEKTPGDKTWSLRCGHPIHQRCLDKISSPVDGNGNDQQLPPDLPVLGGDTGVAKRGRAAKRARTTRKAKIPIRPIEHEWKCPVKHCGRPHKVVMIGTEWKQHEMEGALQMYT